MHHLFRLTHVVITNELAAGRLRGPVATRLNIGFFAKNLRALRAADVHYARLAIGARGSNLLFIDAGEPTQLENFTREFLPFWRATHVEALGRYYGEGLYGFRFGFHVHWWDSNRE